MLSTGSVVLDQFCTVTDSLVSQSNMHPQGFVNSRWLIMRIVSICKVFSILLASVSSVSPVNIGGIFSSAQVQDVFTEVVRNANADPVAYDLGSSKLNSSTALLNSDPIVSIREICSKLINNSVYAVLTDRLVNNTRAPYIVSYACAFYNIPVIGVASRESQFSDKVTVFVYTKGTKLLQL